MTGALTVTLPELLMSMNPPSPLLTPLKVVLRTVTFAIVSPAFWRSAMRMLPLVVLFAARLETTDSSKSAEPMPVAAVSTAFAATTLFKPPLLSVMPPVPLPSLSATTRTLKLLVKRPSATPFVAR